MVPGMGNNLKTLRLRQGWTHQQAADAMHVSRSQFIKLERGDRRLTADYIASAAEAFSVAEAVILAPAATVPVVGFVGAGSEAHYYAEAQGPFDEVPMPVGGTADTVAVEIRGDSLGSMFNTWLVYYDQVRTPPTPELLRELCVVGLVDGRVLVKQLLPGSRPRHFHLLSQTEGLIEDVELEWAAKVKSMTPR